MRKGFTLAFRTVVLDTPCRCTYQGGYLVVRQEDKQTRVHLGEISSIMLGTEQIFLSAYLLAELAKLKIPVIVTEEKHNPVGEYLPLYGAHNCSKCMLEQLAWGEVIKKQVWRSIVHHKILQQAAILSFFDCANESKTLTEYALHIKAGDGTNREAIAARLYFRTLFGSEFTRDLDTPLNASLNYGYSILVSAINREIVSHGYLTQIGIFHHNEYNHFNLSCDFMESFRPVIDKIVYENFNHVFDATIRHILCAFTDHKLIYNDGVYKVESVIKMYVDDCLSALNKEKLPAEIKPFGFLL